MNRGRGRGRGNSGPRPVARDDDGNVVATQSAEGPPPLFPPKELPPLPSPAELQSVAALTTSLHSINGYFQGSPFNLGSAIAGKRKADALQELAAVATLHPAFFPPELTAAQSGRRSRAAQAVYWASHQEQRERLHQGDLAMGSLEELARQEREMQREQEAGAQPRGPGGDEGGEEEESADDGEGGVGPEEDAGGDEEYDMEDAYAEAYDQYDDDEGYDVDDEGGGRDEGVF